MTTHELRGRVLRGEGWGRRLGYPTANLDLAYFRRHPVPAGVYAALTTVHGRRYRALAVVGVPFTWRPNRHKVEIHLLRFSGDLRGRRLTAVLVKKIRPIRTFKNVPTMLQQIVRDVLAANRILASHGQRPTTRRH